MTPKPFATVTPLMPAIKVFVCVPLVPMPMVLKSLVPTLPISILLLPVVRLKPAEAPNAMLLLPVVFRLSALEPMAVLSKPVVLLRTHQKTSCRI
ncbi:MAG: hypothetical protein DME53_07085 [Verrucomicrobia bacterium]|nr:MAG: hypothetical protein DME53_07085 [Verrucomicrobiota bacterium]